VCEPRSFPARPRGHHIDTLLSAHRKKKESHACIVAHTDGKGRATAWKSQPGKIGRRLLAKIFTNARSLRNRLSSTESRRLTSSPAASYGYSSKIFSGRPRSRPVDPESLIVEVSGPVDKHSTAYGSVAPFGRYWNGPHRVASHDPRGGDLLQPPGV